MPENAELRAGRVTSIRAQSRSPDRVSIFIDENFAFGIHRDLLLEFDLAKGKELSAAEQRELVQRDAFFKARAVAYRYLSYRDRSAAEIRRRLQRDDYPSEVVADVVYYLEEKGLVDDHRFAVEYAEGRFRSGGYGPLRVRADLRKKGVIPAAVDAALADVFAARDELLECARGAGAKRWKQLSSESDPLKRKKKVYDHLARRGFRYDMVRRVVDELEDL